MGSDVAGRRPVLDVYARLSRAYNGETIQVDDQVVVCLEELAERDADAGEVFKDNSLSAWKPNVVRKDWEALMARLESGASDGVIVYDLTRFSRKIREGERLVELAAKGIRVWSLSGEYDLATADGRRHFREAMVAAAGESDKISERVRRGKLRKARRGKPSGGGRGFGMPGFAPTPEGWEPGDARERVPDERVTAEQEIVRECYRRLLAGETLTSVVADLNRRGVTTVTGGRWTAPTLGRSLRRAALAGLREHNGQVVGTLAGVDPVVSRAEWERLCALFDGRRRGRPAGRVHWALRAAPLRTLRPAAGGGVAAALHPLPGWRGAAGVPVPQRRGPPGLRQQPRRRPTRRTGTGRRGQGTVGRPAPRGADRCPAVPGARRAGEDHRRDRAVGGAGRRPGRQDGDVGGGAGGQVDGANPQAHRAATRATARPGRSGGCGRGGGGCGPHLGRSSRRPGLRDATGDGAPRLPRGERTAGDRGQRGPVSVGRTGPTGGGLGRVDVVVVDVVALVSSAVAGAARGGDASSTPLAAGQRRAQHGDAV